MNKHEYLVHGIKKFPNVCDICHTPYKNIHKCQAGKKEERRRKEKHKCRHCGKIFKGKTNLRMHIKGKDFYVFWILRSNKRKVLLNSKEKAQFNTVLAKSSK